MSVLHTAKHKWSWRSKFDRNCRARKYFTCSVYFGCQEWLPILLPEAVGYKKTALHRVWISWLAQYKKRYSYRSEIPTPAIKDYILLFFVCRSAVGLGWIKITMETTRHSSSLKHQKIIRNTRRAAYLGSIESVDQMTKRKIKRKKLETSNSNNFDFHSAPV